MKKKRNIILTICWSFIEMQMNRSCSKIHSMSELTTVVAVAVKLCECIRNGNTLKQVFDPYSHVLCIIHNKFVAVFVLLFWLLLFILYCFFLPRFFRSLLESVSISFVHILITAGYHILPFRNSPIFNLAFFFFELNAFESFILILYAIAFRILSSYNWLACWLFCAISCHHCVHFLCCHLVSAFYLILKFSNSGSLGPRFNIYFNFFIFLFIKSIVFIFVIPYDWRCCLHTKVIMRL